VPRVGVSLLRRAYEISSEPYIDASNQAIKHTTDPKVVASAVMSHKKLSEEALSAHLSAVYGLTSEEVLSHVLHVVVGILEHLEVKSPLRDRNPGVQLDTSVRQRLLEIDAPDQLNQIG